MYAAVWSGHTDVVKMLLHGGANIGIADRVRVLFLRGMPLVDDDCVGWMDSLDVSCR